MPDHLKTEPFRPAQPSIPGVAVNAVNTGPPDPPAEPAPAQGGENSSPHRIWMVAALLTLCSIGGALFVWHGISPSHPSEPAAEPVATPPHTADPVKRPGNLPVGPGPVATIEELARPWASKQFTFPDSVTTELVPAMVVHLPDGSYWAFSLREPFGNCILDYSTDLQKLRDDYSFAATHPMVANPCNQTVYDLLRYGGPSDNALVRGDVVKGPGIRPPMAIEVRVEGKQIVAVRME